MLGENKKDLKKILKNVYTEFEKTFPPKKRNYKAEYRKINEKLQEDNFSYEVFLRVLNYKRRIKTEFDEEKVSGAVEKARKSQSIKDKLDALMALDGVGFPTASAILHFLYPKKFVIVDKYTWIAFRKLSKEQEYQKFCKIKSNKIDENYNHKQYPIYNEFVINLSKHHHKTPREIENALMIYGNKETPKKAKP